MINTLKYFYIFNNELNIWHRETTHHFAYSDGENIEERLLQALRCVKDKSTLSTELYELQRDWPSYYHFSSLRANLLRPFASTLLQGSRVLELGCGCGALSRFLAETAEYVCAVEGSKKRAAIAAARCDDLTNITIVADAIQNLPQEIGKFDIVTLIGVLEYAAIFDDHETPALHLLQLAQNFLKPGGCLILAIENKLGLKYFAGIPEDHIGIAWGGITGAYKDHGVKTYSRHELQELLKKSGFNKFEQFVPIPDYKLPTDILTPEGLHTSSNIWNVAPLLTSRRNYEPQGIFNLPNAWRNIVEAELLPDMADSLGFLAYAGGKRNNFTPWSPNILLYHYGVTPRDDKNFAKEATFQKTSSGIKIERKLLYHDGDIKEGQYTFRPISELYIRGTELLEEARKATARPGWTTNDLARALQPWIDALKQNMVEGKLPPKFLDAAPFNATLTSAGNVQFFDLEWIDSGPVDFLSTVTNHLYHSLDKLGGVYQPSDNTPTAYPELILALLHAWGFTFSLRDLKNCWINAKTLWTHLFKNRPTWEELCMCHVFITPSAITDYKSLQAEHKKIINSFSWKITKPLRKTKTWYVKAKTAFRGNPPKKK